MDGHKSGDNNENCGICGTIVCGSVEKRSNGTREEALGQKSTTMHQRSAADGVLTASWAWDIYGVTGLSKGSGGPTEGSGAWSQILSCSARSQNSWNEPKLPGNFLAEIRPGFPFALTRTPL